MLGGWEDEFDYLTLLVPETNQVSLPDRILELGSDSTRFAGYVAGTFATAQAQAGSVFFLNLFNQSPAELRAFYAGRLGFPSGCLSWLQSLRPQAQDVLVRFGNRGSRCTGWPPNSPSVKPQAQYRMEFTGVSQPIPSGLSLELSGSFRICIQSVVRQQREQGANRHAGSAGNEIAFFVTGSTMAVPAMSR